VTYQTVHYGHNRKENKEETLKNYLSNYTAYIVVSVMSCNILDHVDEIRSNKARVTLQLPVDESTEASNCVYLLVYCQYIHAVEWKD